MANLDVVEEMPFAAIDGLKMHYLQEGDWQSDQDTLLLIHGLGSSIRDWEHQIAVLAQYCKVLAVDLRGHGQTDKPDVPYKIAMFTQDLVRLLDSMKLTNLHVVGHSMGGMIAFQLALDHSRLVKTLTIINSAPLVAFPNLRTRFNFWARTLSVKWFGMKKLSTTLAKTVFPKKDQAALREQFIKRWCENDSVAYLNSLHAFRDWNVLPRLSALQCPTLIITGDRDYTPVAFKQFYIQFIKDVHLVVIEDSGHLTIIDQAQKCNQAIIDFILKHEGTK